MIAGGAGAGASSGISSMDAAADGFASVTGSEVPPLRERS